MDDAFVGRVAFAIGSGRCGTHFMAELLGREPGVAASHERNSLNETFHRYCKWYKIPVDREGFLHTKEAEVRADLAARRLSFEASAHLSLSVCELYDRFDAKFILLVRNPSDTVNSYLRKGWYKRAFIRENVDLALGYQRSEKFEHFLGRIAPTGEDFWTWNRLTRVGKLGWYWRVLNREVIDQFHRIPQTHSRIVKLEELTYARYVELASFLGFATTVSSSDYDALVRSRPGTEPGAPTTASWTEAEVREFEREVAPLAEALGYEYRVHDSLFVETTQAAGV